MTIINKFLASSNIIIIQKEIYQLLSWV